MAYRRFGRKKRFGKSRYGRRPKTRFKRRYSRRY